MRRFLLLILLAPIHARAAETIHARYSVYGTILGLTTTVANVQADFLVQPDTYDVRLTYRTAGVTSMIVTANSDSRAAGRFERGVAFPVQFVSTGAIKGEQRQTNFSYVNDSPNIQTLVPRTEPLRDPVPVPEQAGTMDPMSAMAELVHSVNEGGRCDGRVSTFDGRRLISFTSRTAGTQDLPHTSLSSFSGPTLRCDVVSQQLAGFKHDSDEPRMHRPQAASAWFGRLVPNGPLVLVRATFPTIFFGTVTMYLQSAGE